METLRCVICGKEAVTTAAHIPVCMEHWEKYRDEGRKNAMDGSNRPFYRELQEASE